jgi:LuxR family glucitol operon transcriptional activator
MTYSATRLTLFAILGAIESDLRTSVLTHLAHLEPEEVLGEALWITATDRLQRDTEASIGADLVTVLPYVDMGDLHQVLNSQKSQLAEPVAQGIKGITPKLERLIPIRNRIAHNRPLNYDDLARTLTTVEGLLKGRDASWRELRATMKRLQDDPSFVLSLQIPTSVETDIGHNLPTPDFDETGFVGRSHLVDQVVTLIKGPYPVISLIGDGGIGKTALALKVAYEVLDIRPSPFDAIVWTTSKTMQLTPTEIIRIEGAIQDSVGLMRDVVDYLSGPTERDPTEEVLDYLAQFRILLVLDNLETVLDDRIRNLLSRLPSGSKVLITSRIGMGAFEFPVRLEPFTSGESVQLLRTLAAIRGLAFLSKAATPLLTSFSSRMKHNPGYIKWFVSAVQTGSRPEDILAHPDVFLDFCMSNVYDYLGEDSRSVLRALLVVSGPRSSPELAVLTELEPLMLQRALQQLLTTNMVSMLSVPAGTTFQTCYDVSDLAKAYLSKHHPASEAEHDATLKRWRRLVASGERMKSGNPYALATIGIRNHGDIPVAKLLADSLTAAKAGDFSRADSLILSAKSLAPEYPEVHRVEAVVRYSQSNFPAARVAYEAAIELDPMSAPLRFWYGGFLMRGGGTVEEGLEQLETARRLDGRNSLIQMETARAVLWLGDFDRARLILEPLTERRDTLPEWTQRRVVYLQLQIFQRRADHAVGERDFNLALAALLQLREAFDRCPTQLRDDGMRVVLAKAVHCARQCASGLDDAARKSLSSETAEWLAQHARESLPADVELPAGYLPGTVIRVVRERGFGFVRAPDGAELFFHVSNLGPHTSWDDLNEGDSVVFRRGSNDRGPCAVDVQLPPTPGVTDSV